jgi:hypothetical protein
VDLYVTGALMVSDGKIYGQPKGSPPYAKQYSPENLRIFVKGSHNVYFGYLGSPIGAALLYAPESDVVQQVSYENTWMGAIIARSMELHAVSASLNGWGGGASGPDSPGTGKLFYDEALRGRKFPVGPAKVTMLMWGRGSQLAAATTTPTTPSTTATPVPTTTPPVGSSGSTVICTELHRQGYMPDAWLEADLGYARAHIEPETLQVYQAWAGPVAHWMQHSPLVTRAVKPLGLAWAQHMAYEMGQSPMDSRLGATLNAIGLPLHRALSKLFVSGHATASIAQ